jgi:hypothetical protein
MHTPASFGEAEHLLKSGAHLLPDQLATLLESNPGHPLPDGLRKYLVGTLRGHALLPVGRRKTRISAKEDFAYADAMRLYEKMKKHFRLRDARNARMRGKRGTS